MLYQIYYGLFFFFFSFTFYTIHIPFLCIIQNKILQNSKNELFKGKIKSDNQYLSRNKYQLNKIKYLLPLFTNTISLTGRAKNIYTIRKKMNSNLRSLILQKEKELSILKSAEQNPSWLLLTTSLSLMEERINKIQKQKQILQTIKDSQIHELESKITVLISTVSALKTELQNIKLIKMENNSSILIQNGSIAIENSRLTQGNGQRKQEIFVKFEKVFNDIPKVTTAIRSIDSVYDKNLRITVLTKNITKEGFKIVFKTWADTKIYAASGTWVAFG